MLNTEASYFDLSTIRRQNLPADTRIFLVVAYNLYLVYLRLLSKGEKSNIQKPTGAIIRNCQLDTNFETLDTFEFGVEHLINRTTPEMEIIHVNSYPEYHKSRNKQLKNSTINGKESLKFIQFSRKDKTLVAVVNENLINRHKVLKVILFPKFYVSGNHLGCFRSFTYKRPLKPKFLIPQYITVN